MTPKKIILLVVALLLVVGAIQVARTLLAEPEKEEVAEGPPPTRVLVAAVNLAAGKLVKANQVRWDVVDKDADLTNLIVEDTKKKVDFTGAVVRRGARLGEKIQQDQLVRPGERGFLAALMDKGMRAVSVPVTAITGVAGFIFPGDRVDVILTHTVERQDDPNLNERTVSETVLENVRVLALDQKTDDLATEVKVARIATLEVTPKQVEKLSLLREIGTLSLSLRSLNDEDAEIAPVLTAAGEQLAAIRTGADGNMRDEQHGSYTWDSEVSQVLPQPVSRNMLYRNVRILRGGSKSQQSFQLGRPTGPEVSLDGGAATIPEPAAPFVVPGGTPAVAPVNQAPVPANANPALNGASP